jgi:hypothetical protein
MPAPDIADLLAQHRKARRGGRCLVGIALERMEGDPDTRTAILAAMADRDSFAADGLAKVFGALGHEMSRAPVERHRRGDCQCPVT